MGQTLEGSRKQRETMIKKFGSEEAWRGAMANYGRQGGSTKTDKPKGFAANPKLAREVGMKGVEVRKAKKRQAKLIEKGVEIPRKKKFFGLSLSRFKDEYEDLT